MNAHVVKASICVTSACLAMNGFAPSMLNAAESSSPPALSMMMSRIPYDRISAPKFRPRHIRTYSLRADRVGDTPSSSRYFKITNITAEVGGYSGIAYAVNNDGRIAYTDFPATGPAAAYVVNNGGSFGKLVAPRGALRGTGYFAYALNEKAEGGWSFRYRPALRGTLHGRCQGLAARR